MRKGAGAPKEAHEWKLVDFNPSLLRAVLPELSSMMDFSMSVLSRMVGPSSKWLSNS